jgi:hypothetical protein
MLHPPSVTEHVQAPISGISRVFGVRGSADRADAVAARAVAIGVLAFGLRQGEQLDEPVQSPAKPASPEHASRPPAPSRSSASTRRAQARPATARTRRTPRRCPTGWCPCRTMMCPGCLPMGTRVPMDPSSGSLRACVTRAYARGSHRAALTQHDQDHLFDPNKAEASRRRARRGREPEPGLT